MNTRRSWLALLLLAFAAILAPAPAVHAAPELDEAAQSAVFLIRQSMQVSRDGRHNLMLRALRQLADPAMEPIFNQLIQSEHPALKIHGMLGLAECNKDRKLDLVRVAAITAASVQAELVSAAMDSDLLSNDQAKQLVAWPGLDNSVKVVVAQQLIKDKGVADQAFLKEATQAESIARRGLGYLLLLQLGDATAAAGLAEISKSTDPKRDPIREMMLGAALRYEFDSIGPWALSVATEPGVPNSLMVLSLRVALRFNAPGAVEAYVQQYGSNSSVPQRTRLALTALQVAPYTDAKVFEPLLVSDDALIKQIGITAGAIAKREPDVGGKIIALIKLNHPIANDWAFQYARKFATDDDARLVLVSLINAVATGPDRNKAQRIDDAVAAAQVLYERKPADAAKIIRPLLTDEKASPETHQAVLVGLLRAKPSAHELVADLPVFKDAISNNLVLLMLARSGQKLTPAQIVDLGLVVRGGSELMGVLRVQAAWSYLKLTNQTKPAIAQILGQPG